MCTSAERQIAAESKLEMISARNHEVGVSKCNLAKQTPLPEWCTPTIEQRRGARRASDSVEEVQPRENGSVTIEREAAVGARVVCVGLRSVRGIEVGVIVNHVVAHVVCPF
jgi:hypothetical protein